VQLRDGAGPRLERDELTRLCYWMLGLWGFLLYALGPALPALREQLDVSRAVVSLHTTLIAVGAIAVGIAGDRFVVRVGRRAAFWVAAGGIASGALLLAAGGNLVVTLPAAALLGIAGALVVTTLQATLADRHGPLAPVALVEANAIATGLGVLALFAVAVAIWAGSDWRAVFVAASLFAVPAMAIAYGSVCFPAAPELPHDHEPGLPRPYWFYWFALLLFVAIEFCVVFWSTDYLESERGLSDSGAAAASSVFLIGMTVGRALGGPLTRRFGSERLIAVALAVAAAGFAVFWLVPSSTVAVVGLGITGSGVSLLYPLTLALGIAAAGGRTDSAATRAAFAAGIAIALAPFALGGLADVSDLQVAYAIVPALLALGAVALGAAHRRS
jgi:fucose permease